eukprot:TRINITY_DN1172_c0_g1_i1.p1 TRINITY_DN1172_c0_g1~~TRINITY_DN1172_c0_g1_i1.p1  ORF type:complete len:300 (-),score=57.16 TRINITY_DN1172_c0_g1_i1:785-1684(-)
MSETNEIYKRASQIIAGAGSGMITKTAVAPLERLKILYQVQAMTHGEKKYKGILNSLKMIFREEGLRGFYKGNGANVVRVIPVYALKFAFNDWFKDIVCRPGQSVKQLSVGQLMLSGTLAGLFQQSITFPLEFIRTRLSLSSALGETHYKGIVHCAVVTLKKEGISAFYKGYTPTLLSGAPYVGLQMTFYDLFKRNIPGGGFEGNLAFMNSLMCGAMAGLAAQSITFPGDTVRRRMITNGIGGKERHYTTTWDCCKKMLANEGWTSFFFGLKANAVRCIPGAAIQFAAYEGLKTFLLKE